MLIDLIKVRARSIKLVGLRSSIPLGRRYVEDTLTRWGYRDPAFRADAALIVSELVTNAVLVLDALDGAFRERHPYAGVISSESTSGNRSGVCVSAFGIRCRLCRADG
ncbi:hypothetical protein HNP84_002164 [Thermocatellispora tengchongensis]|uniref:Uncharacterized protein n=1 Tax=Thermocatellispora tengchongensis TaxID=1073253 RepID=A0A840NY74_9ACTN|nr:hypothetical protein [Thermocatellispora tengchongensis]MBB5132448.1 hypothetical protein [Thermocatellispora tengchongensis]